VIYGRGQAKFKIYDATPTLIETITLTFANGRNNKTPETREAFGYKNPFTRTKTEKFVGYYIDDVLTVSAGSYPTSKSIDDYYTEQSSSTTENDVSKAHRIANYYDEGYTVRYIRHSDTEGIPYNFYWNVKATVMNLEHPTVDSDSCQLHLEGLELQDSIYGIEVTEPLFAPNDFTNAGGGTITFTTGFKDVTQTVPCDGHLVVRRLNAAVTFDPTDKVNYTVGQDLGSDQIVVYFADNPETSPISFADQSRAGESTYHYEIFPYNGFGFFKNYSTTLTETGTIITP